MPDAMKIQQSVASVLAGKGPELWSVTPESTVFEAIQLMAGRNVGALPVLVNGLLVGLVSEREYTRGVAVKGRSSRDTQVREIMLVDVPCASPVDSVEHCMELMTVKKVRHLPVVEGDEVVGIVSIGDLVKAIISAQDSMIQQLESYIHGGYPG